MLDPILDMTVELASPAGKFGFDGEPAKARQTWQPPTANQHPARHVESTPAVPGAIYACSMDPEVRQRGAGACPECGMALEAARRAPRRRDTLSVLWNSA